MFTDKEKNSDASEKQFLLNSQYSWKRALGWANNHKKRLALSALVPFAGASVLYDTFVNHGGNFSLDNFSNLNRAEANGVYDAAIDPTAPTFLAECADAHLNPGTIQSDPIYIKNTKLIGVFVGFPDQTQGIADLQAGKYNSAYLNKATVVPDFYNHFMGINMTVQTRPYVIMDHPWSYYDYDGTTWPSTKIYEELVHKNFFTEQYNGNTYPVYQIFDAHNPGVPERMGGSGSTTRTYGFILTQGNMLIEDINNGYNLKKVMLHETGHAFTLNHNTNYKSIMNPSTDVDNQPTLLVDQSDIAQLIKPQIGAYKNYLPVIKKGSN